MHHTDMTRGRPVAAVTLIVLACLLIAACGGSSKGSTSSPGAATTSKSTPPAQARAQVQALVSFAACMRGQGVNLAPPNTSGKGPVFNLNGLNTSGAKFKAARARCKGSLRGAAPAHPKLLPGHKGSGGSPQAPGAAQPQAG
jgi:hypothetical protein